MCSNGTLTRAIALAASRCHSVSWLPGAVAASAFVASVSAAVRMYIESGVKAHDVTPAAP